MDPGRTDQQPNLSGRPMEPTSRFLQRIRGHSGEPAGCNRFKTFSEARFGRVHCHSVENRYRTHRTTRRRKKRTRRKLSPKGPKVLLQISGWISKSQFFGDTVLCATQSWNSSPALHIVKDGKAEPLFALNQSPSEPRLARKFSF